MLLVLLCISSFNPLGQITFKGTRQTALNSNKIGYTQTEWLEEPLVKVPQAAKIAVWYQLPIFSLRGALTKVKWLNQKSLLRASATSINISLS